MPADTSPFNTPHPHLSTLPRMQHCAAPCWTDAAEGKANGTLPDVSPATVQQWPAQEAVAGVSVAAWQWETGEKAQTAYHGACAVHEEACVHLQQWDHHGLTAIHAGHGFCCWPPPADQTTKLTGYCCTLHSQTVRSCMSRPQAGDPGNDFAPIGLEG